MHSCQVFGTPVGYSLEDVDLSLSVLGPCLPVVRLARVRNTCPGTMNGRSSGGQARGRPVKR